MGNSISGTTSEETGDLKPKKNGAFQISREPLGDAPLPDPAAHKFETTREELPAPPAAPAFEDLGELPQSYGAEPFSSWLAIRIGSSPTGTSTGPRGRPRPTDGKFYLKLFTCRRLRWRLTTEIHPEARNWYIPVKQAGALVLRGTRLPRRRRRMDLHRPLRRRLHPGG